MRGDERRKDERRGEKRRGEKMRWYEIECSDYHYGNNNYVNGLIMSNKHSDEDDQNSNLNTHCFSVNTVNNVILIFIYRRFTFKFKRNPLLFPSITNTLIRCV